MDIRNLLPSAPASPVQRLNASDVEEMLEQMFAPPSVDAGQVPMHAYTRLETGEMRLALAILEDALRCALRHHDSRITEQRLAAREAMDWIRDTLHRRMFQARVAHEGADRTRHAA